MTTITETSESGALDVLKLLIAAALLVGGFFGYYWFAPNEDWDRWQRLLLVLGGLAACVGVAGTSTQGQRLWAFIQGSRIEIRKVVWPTKQETTQTAIAVFIFTLVMSLFFWALDSVLLWVTRRLVGSAG